MKTKNITRLIGTGLLESIIVCIMLLIGSFTPSMARGRHSVSRRPHYTHRNHVYRTFRPTRGTVFLTRPRGGRYHYIGKHRYWMAVRYSTNGKERDTIHCYKGSKVKKGKI